MLTRNQINQVIRNTPENLKGLNINDFIHEELGSFTKSNIGWICICYFINYNGLKIIVATVYGEIQ
ncbi:MAG: hypothetical protein RR832_05795 [Bacilli bacterium]